MRIALTMMALAMTTVAAAAAEPGEKSKKIYDYQQQVSADVPFAQMVRQALVQAGSISEAASACAQELNRGPILFNGDALLTRTGEIADSRLQKEVVESIGTRIVCAVSLGDHVPRLQAAVIQAPAKTVKGLTSALTKEIADNLSAWNDQTIKKFNRIGIDVIAESMNVPYTNRDSDKYAWPFKVLVGGNNAGATRDYVIYSPQQLNLEGQATGASRYDLGTNNSKFSRYAVGGIFEARTIGPAEFIAEIRPGADNNFVVSKNGTPYWTPEVIGGRQIRLQITASGKTQFLGD